ncbi:MAG TPA: hypothetical protein VFJ91_07520 [Gaiellaceae bacterium]|nr:hypothetical protein [Gaiellaceae bacterium]
MSGVVRALLLCALVAAVGAAAASASVIGPTPRAAALAATKKFAAHEVVAWTEPGVSYTLGACRLLHRRPWLGYACGFELHGVPDYCHGVLTVSVKRLANGTSRAQGVKSKYVDTHGC